MTEEYKRGYRQAVEDVVKKFAEGSKAMDCRYCPADAFCDQYTYVQVCNEIIKAYLLKEVEDDE